MNFSFSKHSLSAFAERGLDRADVLAVAENPQQIVLEKNGRKAYQSTVNKNGRDMLLRVIVYDDKDPTVIITAYQTSNIKKYWKP